MAMGYLVRKPRQKHNVNFEELRKHFFLNTAHVTFLFSPIMDALMTLTLHNIEHRDTHYSSKLDLLNDSSQLCDEI